MKPFKSQKLINNIAIQYNSNNKVNSRFPKHFRIKINGNNGHWEYKSNILSLATYFDATTAMMPPLLQLLSTSHSYLKKVTRRQGVGT